MSAERLLANLLRMANADLEGARLLAVHDNRNAIYLCEQAAEKIIRAVLTAEGKRAGIGHQLHLMVDLVPDENPMRAALRAIEHLAAYATSYRYPTSAGRITEAPGQQRIEGTSALSKLRWRMQSAGSVSTSRVRIGRRATPLRPAEASRRPASPTQPAPQTEHEPAEALMVRTSILGG